MTDGQAVKGKSQMSSLTKDTLPWKLPRRDRSFAGPLTEPQISDLARQFGFEPQTLRNLSDNLRTALSPLNLSQPELGPARVKKAVQVVKKCIKALRAAEVQIEKTDSLIQGIQFKSLYPTFITPDPGFNQLNDFKLGKSYIHEFCQYLEVMERNELVFYKGVPDKRKIRDIRRQMVCFPIFSIWSESGRNLTYTTDFHTSQRGGQLFDFVNAVVACITDPPSMLHGDAIKQELEEYLGPPPGV